MSTFIGPAPCRLLLLAVPLGRVLPLGLVEPAEDGLTRLQVALGHPDATVGTIDGIVALLRREGIESDVAAATVETIAGRRVGRLLVELADPSQAARAHTLLGTANLHPEVAA